MPQTGWDYPDWKGTPMTHDELMELAELYPTDFPFAPEILDKMLQHTPRDFVSPTTLASCPRKGVLERQVDYSQEPQKAYAAFRGTLAHTLLEHLNHEPGALLERRVRCNLDLQDGRVVELRGQPDKLVPSMALILDYKTLKDKDLEKSKDGWIPQLSSYRWMLNQPHEVWDEATGTWQSEEPFLYTRAQIQKLTMEAAGKTEITMWPLDVTEAWLRGRMKMWAGVFDGTYDLDNLPPILQFGLDADAYLCFGRRDKATGEETTRPWCSVYKSCRERMRAGV